MYAYNKEVTECNAIVESSLESSLHKSIFLLISLPSGSS